MEQISLTAEIIRRLERLVELAPEYVPAILLLGNAYYYASGDGPGAVYSPAEGQELATAMNRRALTVDPMDGPANAYAGWIEVYQNKDLHSGAVHLRRAFALEPGNAEVISNAGIFARWLGRFDDAVRLGEMSIARDPACPQCYYWLGINYWYAGNYERAEWAYRERMRVGPGGWISIGWTLLLRGRYEEALDAMSRQVTEDEPYLQYRAMVFYSQGRIDDYNDSVQQLLAGIADEESVQGTSIPYDMAWLFAWSGDVDRAFEWLEKAAVAGDFRIQYAHWDPFLENLRQDPRWPEFIARHWYTEEELAAVEFDLFPD